MRLFLLLFLVSLSLPAQEILLRQDGSLKSGTWSGSFDQSSNTGRRVLFACASVDFYPKISITLPDGSLKELEPDTGYGNMSLFIPTKGKITLSVTASDGSTTGFFSLKVKALPVRETLKLSTSREGVIETATADKDSDGHLIDWYPLAAKRGDRIALSMNSEYDNYMILEFPDGTRLTNDDAEGSNSGIIFRANQDGIYQVGAASYESTTTGAYNLSVLPGPTPKSLALGKSTRGDLEEGDPVIDGKLADLYTLNLKPGIRYEATLESEDFDAFLSIQSADGKKWDDDDTAGDNNSLLRFSPTQGESVDVVVTSAESESSGSYTLILKELPLPENLTLGGKKTGAVSSDDTPLSEDHTGDEYSFKAEPGKIYTIKTEDVDFDTVLAVTGVEGVRYENDDISADDTASKIHFSSPAGGIVFVEVYGSGDGDEGNYRISLNAYNEGNIYQSYKPGATLTPTSRILSYLTPTSEIHSYKIRLPADRITKIDLRSSGFDTLLKVKTPQGIILENDDTDQGTNSFLEVQGESGDFEIQVIALEDEGSSHEGLYSLELTPGPKRSEIFLQTGELKESSPVDLSGRVYETHSFPVKLGQKLLIEAVCKGFDGFLYLQSAKGGKLAEDDDSGNNYDPRIEWTSNITGTIKIAVTRTEDSDELGSYTLKVFEILE